MSSNAARTSSQPNGDLSVDQKEQIHQVSDTWSPWHMLPARIRLKLRRFWSTIGFDHTFATLLRHEMDMTLLRARTNFSPSRRRMVRVLQQKRSLLVHLGCGNALLPGWINVDCYPPSVSSSAEVLTTDMRQGLPFSDSSVAAIFSEHFLEHLPIEVVGKKLLPELFRILEPGGKLRLSIPNGEYFITQYLASKTGQPDNFFVLNSGQCTPMEMLNNVTHGYGHRYLYDFASMQRLLADSCFTGIKQSSFARSEFPVFANLDRQDEWRIAMSLYVEAVKPN